MEFYLSHYIFEVSVFDRATDPLNTNIPYKILFNTDFIKKIEHLKADLLANISQSHIRTVYITIIYNYVIKVC